MTDLLLPIGAISLAFAILCVRNSDPVRKGPKLTKC
jgi:hypothetical protein